VLRVQMVEGKTVRSKGFCLKDGKEEECEMEGVLDSEKEGIFKYRIVKHSSGELKDDDKKEKKEILVLLTEQLAVKVFPDSGMVRIFSRKPTIDDTEFKRLIDMLDDIAPGKLGTPHVAHRTRALRFAGVSAPSESLCAVFVPRAGCLCRRHARGAVGGQVRRFPQKARLLSRGQARDRFPHRYRRGPGVDS
jgi:hypothetical protein